MSDYSKVIAESIAEMDAPLPEPCGKTKQCRMAGGCSKCFEGLARHCAIRSPRITPTRASSEAVSAAFQGKKMRTLIAIAVAAAGMLSSAASQEASYNDFYVKVTSVMTIGRNSQLLQTRAESDDDGNRLWFTFICNVGAPTCRSLRIGKTYKLLSPAAVYKVYQSQDEYVFFDEDKKRSAAHMNLDRVE